MPIESNPFSTKFWTPGAIPFRFAEANESCERLVTAFERHGSGQIVGPHGSGKSTLIESLKTIFQRNGYDIHHVTLNDRNRRLPKDFFDSLPGVRIVDGFEQLPFWNRWRLLRRTPERLLIVTHRPVGRLPILYRTIPRFDIFMELVRRLGGNDTDVELYRLFETSGGNFRNAFLELYDRRTATCGRGSARRAAPFCS